MGPQVWGWQHLTFLAIYWIFVTTSTIFIVKYVDKKHYAKIVKSLAIINLILLFFDRFIITDYHLLTISILPQSYCATSAFLGSMSLLICKENSKVFNFTLFAGAFGGILTIFYPDYIALEPTFLNPITIISLLYHGLMFYILVIAIATGYFKPEFKNWYVFILGYLSYFIYGVFQIKYLNIDNAMYLQGPAVNDTIFTGPVLAVILILLYTLIIYIYNKVDNEKIYLTIKNLRIFKKEKI